MTSASIGVTSSTPFSASAPADLLSRANASLYRAEKQGRDRVVTDRE